MTDCWWNRLERKLGEIPASTPHTVGSLHSQTERTHSTASCDPRIPHLLSFPNICDVLSDFGANLIYCCRVFVFPVRSCHHRTCVYCKNATSFSSSIQCHTNEKSNILVIKAANTGVNLPECSAAGSDQKHDQQNDSNSSRY